MTLLAIIDTETTGTIPGVHQAYEIAVIRRDDVYREELRWWLPVDLSTADPVALRIGRYYQRRPRPLVDTPDMAVAWDADGVQHLLRPREVAAQLARLLDGAMLVGLNVAMFDVPMIAQLLRAHGECPTWDHRVRELSSMAAGYVYGLPTTSVETRHSVLPTQDRKRGTSIERMAEAVGINPGEYELHTALGDARLQEHIHDTILLADKEEIRYQASKRKAGEQ